MLKVTLQNPEAVSSALESIGEFASVCKSEAPPTNPEILRKIGLSCLKSGHYSPCRHIMWYFKVEKVSRVYSHQQVRHSIGIGTNQASGVFMPITADVSDFVIPPKVVEILCKDKELADRYFNYISEALALNEILVQRGASNSDARYHMPQSTPTALNIAFSPEALIHVAHERLCSKAQWEIRAVIRNCCKQVIDIEPEFRQFLQPKCFYLHECNERDSCGLWAKHLEIEEQRKAATTNEQQ